MDSEAPKVVCQLRRENNYVSPRFTPTVMPEPSKLHSLAAAEPKTRGANRSTKVAGKFEC